MAGLILIGCGDDGAQSREDTSVGGVDITEPAPWIVDVSQPTSAVPALPATSVAEATLGAARLAAGIDPRPLLALHDALLPPPMPGSGQLLGCPIMLTYEQPGATGFFWQGDCTREDGTTFSGRGTVVRYDNFPANGAAVSGFELSMAGTISAADGTHLDGTGRVARSTASITDIDVVVVAFDGTFIGAGPAVDRDPIAAWLDGTRAPSLEVSRWTYTPTGGRNLVINGSMGGLAAITDFPADVTAIAFEDFTVRELTAGNPCEREAGGLVAARDAEGRWTEVLFDGFVENMPAPPQALCDGCGDSWLRGTPGDPVCLDPRPLLGVTPEPAE